jgi:ferredoxin
MTYRIIIDRTACSGFGSCVETDPDTFALGDDGVAQARSETTERAAAVAAARSCPMGAITILDEHGSAVR